MSKHVVGVQDKKKSMKRAAEEEIQPVSKKANTGKQQTQEFEKPKKQPVAVVEETQKGKKGKKAAVSNGDQDADFEEELDAQIAEMMRMMEEEDDEDNFEGEEGDFEMYEDMEEDDDMLMEGEDENMELDDEDEENADLDEMLNLEAVEKPKKKNDKKKDKKKKKSADEEDDEDTDVDEELEANFDFCDPDADKDYHAVKNFIRNLVEDKDFDASSVADIISGQAGVGTVIRSSGDDSLGFVTCLDYAAHKDVSGIKQLRKFVLANAGSDADKKKLDQYFSKGLGLQLHDRVVNMPMEVVPALYNELAKDIEYAQKVQKGQWKFDNYLLLIKCCEVSGKIAAKDKRDLFYTKFEEEFFHQRAVFTKKFASKQSIPWSGVGKLPASIIACVVPAKALGEVRDILVKIIGLNGEESFF